MKKLLCLMLQLLVLLPLAAVLLPQAMSAEESGEDVVEFVLHKRMIRDIDYNDQFEYHENDGLAISEEAGETADIISQTVPLNGATFAIYDMTDYYHEKKAAENMTPKEFVQQIAETNRNNIRQLITEERLVQIGTSVTTGKDTVGGLGDGIARIKAPKKNQDRDAVYLIFEESIDPEVGLDVDIDQTAIPIAAILPIYHPTESSEELQEIHIYPKNVGYLRDPYFFKYGRQRGTTEKGKPLEGAVFALYQMIEGGKYYLDMAPANDLKNQWIKPADNDPLNDKNVSKFISDKEGLVTTGQRFLPSGTYYFEELKGVEGYEMDEASKRIEVIIPEFWVDAKGQPQYVVVNGQEMAELESGKVPVSAYESATPRVYNETVKETTDKPKEPSGPSNPGQSGKWSVFPQTNEARTLISLLGILLLLGAVLLIKKERGEKMNKKMIVTGMSVLLLVTAGIGIFGNGKLVKAEEVAQKPSEVTITLHKKGFSSVPEERPNSGLVSTDFGEENIPGVDFDLFDVTEVYYDLIRDNPLTPEREDGLNSAEAIEWIQKRHTESWFLKYRLTSIDKQTTNEAGEAVFSTVQVTEEAPSSRDKVYLFLETYSPAHISRIASPMVVMMPVMMPDMVDGVWDGSTWKDTYNTDVHLYPKNEIREADKQMNVEESDLRQVTIINEAGEQETISYIDLERGKTASYTITAPIPYFIDSVLENGSAVIKNYKITDTPTVGLTYYDQEIEVRAGETILTKGQDYIVEVVSNGFVVTILTEENGVAKVDTLGRLADARGGDLTITYNLKVSTELEADDFHNNTAVIEIGRNDEFDYEEGVEPPEKVTTGGRKFEKYDASSSELLKDARFELWNEDRSEYAIFYKGESPLAVYESGADRIEWATSGQATEFVADGNGYFEVQGLDYGTYQMKETMAPEGYVLPTGEAAFTEFIISYGSYNEEIQIVGVENPGPERVPNMKRGSLSATGGNGLLAFLLIGISLMIGAYSWYRKSKMKSEV